MKKNEIKMDFRHVMSFRIVYFLRSIFGTPKAEAGSEPTIWK